MSTVALDLFPVAAGAGTRQPGTAAGRRGHLRVVAEDERRAGPATLRITRRGRLAHLVDTLGEDETEALAIDHAGLGIFATALALASGTDRDLTVLSLAENQYARLVLSLRAAGLDRADLERQFFLLHPDISVPGEIAQLPLPRARMLLAGDAQ